MTEKMTADAQTDNHLDSDYELIIAIAGTNQMHSWPNAPIPSAGDAVVVNGDSFRVSWRTYTFADLPPKRGRARRLKPLVTVIVKPEDSAGNELVEEPVPVPDRQP